MIPYTRVTIVAPSRRAEIVMPSDEPIGAQFPALLSLLGMTAGTELPSLRLVRPNGAILQLEGDLASQRIPDGEILRLVPDDEVPPPAEISDVTGALTAATDVHPWRWKTSDRLLGTGALLLLAGILFTCPTTRQRGSGPSPDSCSSYSERSRRALVTGTRSGCGSGYSVQELCSSASGQDSPCPRHSPSSWAPISGAVAAP